MNSSVSCVPRACCEHTVKGDFPTGKLNGVTIFSTADSIVASTSYLILDDDDDFNSDDNNGQFRLSFVQKLVRIQWN